MTPPPALDPALLTPLQREAQEPAMTRPSLSYWADAWRQLRANRQAMASLMLILMLVVFSTLGPVIWNVDPSSQDLDQVGIAPGADRSVTLWQPYRPWSGPSDSLQYSADTLHQLTLATSANTQAVRLAWVQQQDASAYRVYRNLYPVSEVGSLGLPLATLKTDSFEDRLDLSPTRYYYSIVGLNSEGQEVGTPSTIAVEVRRVITVENARARGLLGQDEAAEIGDRINLALHPLGTDYLGRDMLARLMHGGRVSLFIGLFAPLGFMLLGIVYGSVAGFIGGNVDQLLMRLADFVVALPFLLFMILLKVLFGIGPGESGIWPMLLAMVILLWPAPARLVRGQILQLREQGYVDASRLLGTPTAYLIGRHMLPNTLGVILVTLTFQVPGAIFTEAFLSFIGMGVAPPTPSWGAMCNEGIKSMLTRPHEILFPALLISATVLAFNLLGDGLRDALDARMRGSDSA